VATPLIITLPLMADAWGCARAHRGRCQLRTADEGVPLCLCLCLTLSLWLCLCLCLL